MKELFNKFITRIASFSPEFWLVLILLFIAALAHGVNMLHYPYFENDEATYVSQAWSFIHEGKLAPYTYYYDHAPAGWIFLGIWFLITGGLTTFGQNPLISGRIFIFVLHMLSVLFLYIITKRVARQKLAATLAVLVFSLSPLELYYGRRVYLDNIMIFWILISLFFATKTHQRLRDVILSAAAFAVATLTKENALFMGPAIVYTIWIYSQARIRIWSISQWIIVSISLIALYPLYAILKGELFMSNGLLGGTNNHVSLIQSLLFQVSRGNAALPWQSQSDFYGNLMVWLNRDPWIIIMGSVCLLASTILNERYREIKAIALTIIAEVLFLARGKFILDFYILAILPFLAMMIGIMISRPVIWAKNHISPKGYSLTASFILILVFLTSGTPAFSRDETTNQLKAISWIEQNLSKNTFIAIDNYAYPQLHDVDGFKNADFSFKIQYDPSVRSSIYNSNPGKIEYLLMTHAEIDQIRSGQFGFVQQAFNQGQLVADYTDNSTSYIDINKLISTNGDWAQVYKVDEKNAGLLADNWRNYKRNFIKDSGQVIDTSAWVTTSEGQSYALQRSFSMNDQVEFERVWKWTKENLQVRPDDKLFVWKVMLDEKGINHLTDTNSASDADEDIAYVLYNAYQKWGEQKYLTESKKILADVWKYEVVNRNNKLYFVSAPEQINGKQLLLNPSYIAPHEYKIFSKIDPGHNWQKLVDDSYELLSKLQKQFKAGLFSNWVSIDQNGDPVSAARLITQSADTYGYDAFRVNARMADDVQDLRAQAILQKLTDFYKGQWTKYYFISSEYNLNGEGISENSDISTSAGAVIGLHAMKEDNIADAIYYADIIKRYHINGAYWGQPKNYYSQNWAAFAVQYLGAGGHGTKGDTLADIGTK